MALGETLRRARQEQKLTASEVAAGTRMMVQMVEALEREDFSQVAATIYGKGFIRMYAQYVHLDPEPLIQEYMDRFVEPPRDTAPTVSAPTDIFEEDGEGSPWWWPFGGADEEELEDEPDKPVPAPIVTQEPAQVTTVEAEPTEEEPEPIETDEPESDADPDLFSHIKRHREEVQEAEEDDEPLIDITALSDALSNARTGCAELFGSMGQSIGQMVESAKAKLANIEISLPEIKVPESNFKSIPLVVLSVIIVIFVISGLSRCAREDRGDPGTETVIDEPAILRLAVEADEPYID